MPLRPAHLPLGALLLPAMLVAEEASREPAPRSATRALLFEKIKAQAGPFKPPETPATPAPPILVASVAPPKPPPDVVLLDPYLVTEKAGPSLKIIDQGMKKAEDLKSKALFHKDLKSGTRLEFLLPPGGGKNGGIELPFFRMSW